MNGALLSLAQQEDAARSLAGATLAIIVGAGALFILLLVLMIMRRVVLGGSKPKPPQNERVDPWAEAGKRMRIDDEPQQLGGELGERIGPDGPSESDRG